MKKFFKNVRYLLEYIILVVLMRILSLFGIDRSADICSYIARKIGPLLQVDKIARRNIQYVFGNSINQEEIIDQVWDNFGRFIGEFPYINKMSEAELSKRVEIVGLENVIPFQKIQQPYLFFTGHFANWDLIAKVLPKLYPKFAIIYRKANNPYVDKIIADMRNNDNVHFIPKGNKGVHGLIKAIKSGYAIGMLIDQKMNDGIEVPFLGRPSKTAHAIAKIALQFNYSIVPIQIIRTKGSYFKVIIHPPLEIQRSTNNEVDCYNIMLSINQTLEAWVKEYPGQWFWFHNRWEK